MKTYAWSCQQTDSPISGTIQPTMGYINVVGISFDLFRVMISENQFFDHATREILDD